ncbi:alpha/beta fold hydrolase [Flammeovirga yaeyamensis]|uniref:Alpha/beta fold hydrolase n=1 Tax=Flammeovirga yaeyamensis TaxID=367791 RepID=A0AAX1N4T8_9BACT|nr:alpha/beta hydrolase [Flammeovirga yaeyamensis]MBB3698234.1 pimeloyl-ACP methyl ester carboxylesterase [Flammeovirga yaeyamensis]NMF34411.1 alpha/beta hydrolase [Flammeovirga yaeyamensis]QWG01391.1 alpha/beta fold hydrolase [Flammeovirga yaeyamensis]
MIHKTTLQNQTASYFDISSEGTPAHFYGANGFPSHVYEELLNELSGTFALKSLLFRACWDDIPTPKGQVKWQVYADDLIEFIEQNYDEPIVGIGHSQGATATLLAYIKKPELFKELILIEPASVSKLIQLIFHPLPLWIKKKMKPMIATLAKKEKWEDTLTFFEYLRENQGYKRFDDQQLFLLAQRSLNSNSELVFPASWEMLNYGLPVNLDQIIKNVKVPLKIIAGKPSLFLSEKVRKHWKSLNPNLNLVEITDYGHLLPLENPSTTAKEILNR